LAVGTTSWSISSIDLVLGPNEIAVTAHDGDGNTISDALTVTYTAPSTNNDKVTMVPSSVRPWISNTILQPETGNQFVLVYLNVTNGLADYVSLNPYYFELTCANSLSYSYSWSVDYSMADAIAPGGTAPVSIGFEIPNNTIPSTIAFYDYVHSSSCSLTSVWDTTPILPPVYVTLGTPTYAVTYDDLWTPDAGNRFILVTVSMTNTGDSSLVLNPFYFSLSTSDGLDHDYTYMVDYDVPDGLQAGATYTIKLGFEISQTANPVSLRFDDYENHVTVTF
jgi:hypothetical protein